MHAGSFFHFHFSLFNVWVINLHTGQLMGKLDLPLLSSHSCKHSVINWLGSPKLQTQSRIFEQLHPARQVVLVLSVQVLRLLPNNGGEWSQFPCPVSLQSCPELQRLYCQMPVQPFSCSTVFLFLCWRLLMRICQCPLLKHVFPNWSLTH